MTAAAAATPLTQGVRIVEYEQSESVRVATTTTADPDNPIFAGHYPGFPIFPGVCLIECAHRSVLAAAERAGVPVELETVMSTRFLHPAFPGDEIRTDAVVSPGDGSWTAKAVVHAAGQQAAKVRLRYRLREEQP